MPHVGTASGNALLVWCLIAIAVCVCVVLNPVKFFRALAWGRPLPKVIEKRWVLASYRVVGAAIFIKVLTILIDVVKG
jgi:hypothetical protein